MPPSVKEWLPEDHLAFFVLDVVVELDLAAFYAAYRVDGRSGAVYDPAMMLAVLLYAYCTGERSSRRIERRLVEDVAYRVLAAESAVLITPRWPGSGAVIKTRSLGCSARCWGCA